jgi:hypothetical protein
MKAEPLSKAIYNKAKELGIEKIFLKFSGGSDEGNLYVELSPYDKDNDGSFSSEIENWAWEVYSYSGAGDGSDYGDDITYDLAEGEVSTSEWFHIVKEEATGTTKLEIDEK